MLINFKSLYLIPYSHCNRNSTLLRVYSLKDKLVERWGGLNFQTTKSLALVSVKFYPKSIKSNTYI